MKINSALPLLDKYKKMKSFIQKYSFLSYTLIALGQLWLFSMNSRTEGLFERVTQFSSEWIGSHTILMVGALLIFPTTILVKEYFKGKRKYLVYTATALTFIGAFALIGQFVLDFYLTILFGDLTAKSAYEELHMIQSNKFIKVLCYDLVGVWLLGQILFIIALFNKENYPKWALFLFVLGILLMIFGDSFHEILERLSYILISIALLPIFSKNNSIEPMLE